MKITKSIYRIVSFMLMTAVLITVAGSCVEELDGGIEDGPEQEFLAFSARFSDEATKATPMTLLDGEAGIIGYIYKTWPASTDAIKTFAPWSQLQNKSFTFDGDQLEATSGMVKWSAVNDADGNKLKVYAYSPASAPGMEVSFGTKQNYTFPTITYTSPDDIYRQTDIVTAVAEVATDFNKNIPLTFDHILTGIKFKAGFDCTVKSITISNVASTGKYTIGEGWEANTESKDNYEVTFKKKVDGNLKTVEKTVAAGDMITDETDGTVLFMIPQTFAEGSAATITLEYTEDGKNYNKITTSLAGKIWEEGRMITYTLHKKEVSTGSNTIYFDLAAGNVTINGTSYTGKIYVGGQAKEVNGTHVPENRYYVYQSSELDARYNHENTGYRTIDDYNNMKDCRVPKYPEVTLSDGTSWREFITNNQVVEDIIEYWDNGANIREDRSAAPGEKHTDKAVVRDAGREHTLNYIHVTGSGKYNLTIDNIYSVIQERVHKSPDTFRRRAVGGIAFRPTKNTGTELSVNFVGDNRMGCLHIDNGPSDIITLEGEGTLTVADTDFITKESEPGYINNDFGADIGSVGGYISNFWNSAIGNNTHDGVGEKVHNLFIKSGVIFAGTTKAEDCTAIGGGGNGFGQIYITGGVVTAVATTAGTAIGGGMGHTGHGGPGEVHISGGNVYAYNHATKWGIPSSAIGGGGSEQAIGSEGKVYISGGNIYAYSELGTAIGGGSSKKDNGGAAVVEISGGYIVAKSGAGNGIGGGSGGAVAGNNGGSANITISGAPVIRTGSVGGGKTNNSTGKIGSATINISGGDIQAQFVMAAGSGSVPTFTMTGGLIRNSDTDDLEYIHLQKNGGAVYLEDGKFTMSGGEIRQCLAEKGGAIYVKGTASTTFNMTGGTITECAADTDGGAVYLEGGVVNISGGTVSHNLANNGNGGGFCIVGGNFSMDKNADSTKGNAQIFENAAFSQTNTGGKGGGIYVTSTGNNVNVSILSGSITQNSSDRVGGGLAVDMVGNSTAAANVTVGTKGGDKLNPSISSNHTIVMGGGLYAKGANANITINSGKIRDNSISGYVSNPDVANEEGTVTLNGGDVKHVTVTYNNNAKFLGLQDSYVEEVTQDIVTATNSRMVVSKQFSMPQHTFNGWNTRPDGKGTPYSHGQVMNLSSDLTLYAQWSRNISN